MMGILNALKGIGGELAMAPRLAQPDVADRFGPNGIVSRNGGATSAVASDDADLRLGQLGTCLPFSAGGTGEHSLSALPRWMQSAPLFFVSLVLNVRSPSQVLWIAARGLVAAMQRDLPLRSRPSVDKQRDVRRNEIKLYAVTSESHDSVPARVAIGSPVPAVIGTHLGDFRPEAILYKLVYLWQVKFSHIRLLNSRVGQGRALLTQRFRPVFPSRIACRSQGFAL